MKASPKGLAGLNDFLGHSRSKLLHLAGTSSSHGNSSNCIAHVVMGNEASDLDSMVSSTFHAYFRSYNPLFPSTGRPLVIFHYIIISYEIDEKEYFYVPVMNIPREDFSLRTEAAWLFDKVVSQFSIYLSFSLVVKS